MWHLKHSAGWNPVGPTKHMGYAQMRSDTLAINYAYVRHNGPVGIRNIPQINFVYDCSVQCNCKCISINVEEIGHGSL